ncbi:MAG: VOC family protein [Pseudomonadota bacterium]
MSAAKQYIVECDHVMLCVERLEDASIAFRRLGFNCEIAAFEGRLGESGRAMDAHFPFRNGHVKMAGPGGSMNYLEIMEIRSWADAPEQMRFVGDSSGVASMVFLVDDEDGFRDAMIADGLPVHPTFRQLGEEAFTASTRALIPDLSGFRFFTEYVLCPIVPKYGVAPFMWNAYHIKTDLDQYTAGFMADASEHANGALEVTGAIGVTDTPEDDAARMAQMLGATVEANADGTWSVVHKRFTLQVVDRRNLSEVFPGIQFNEFLNGSYTAGVSVAVADLEKTRELLAEQGVGHVALDNSLLVQPSEACGTLLRFHCAP